MSKSIKTQVIDFVISQGGTARFVDIQKFIVEGIKGWEYDYSQRGYFTAAFTTPSRCRYTGRLNRNTGYFLKPGREPRYLKKCPNGLYAVIA